ncbi:MAG TPA: polysaccharide biosynthesis tyrosine autokinase [Gammaproteobacteria bacterium]|nr:polysaccharide biosynthesis tyrosine autokinase [Gammaproteobacteria bacterium]
MKIKNLMDHLNNESDVRKVTPAAEQDPSSWRDEKVTYIENARVETVAEQAERKALLVNGTQWANQSMGDILIELGKLNIEDVGRIIDYQREKGLYFGEAAIELKLVDQDDILQALSTQFGYTYNQAEERLSKDMVMAYSPFGEQAEEFRSIRSQLLSNWYSTDRKTLAVVSPENGEGRSYVAANLALAFSQLGRPTLLIDADLRAPSQHEIFRFSRRIGLSMLLAGRIKLEDMDVLPDQISSFQHLSVLGCGAIPPNPGELLSQERFPLILRELKKYYDVIILDAPPATYSSDVRSIAAVAGSALLVTRSGRSKMDKAKELMNMMGEVKANVVGAVLNQF